MAWRKFIKDEENDVIKSASDPRSYRVICLTNGLRIILISDSETVMSSAALDVHVGWMSDPDDILGLTHLCEHMLFLGTEKYPDENDFSKFVSEHGDNSDASTATQHTNYRFDVDTEKLEEALDRFAQFFISPLFTESAIEREVKSVNLENDNKSTNDYVRLDHVERTTMTPGHPYCKFRATTQKPKGKASAMSF